MPQRVSDGLEVPKLMMDTFAGKTTEGPGVDAGKVYCDLTYVPKSIGHILTPLVQTIIGYIAPVRVDALSGKTVTLRVYAYVYYKTISVDPADGACDGSGWFPSHGSHDLYYSYKGCDLSAYPNIALDPIRISYTVA